MKRNRRRKVFKIPEYIVVNMLREYLNECDADDLARLLGDIFGGKCFQDSNDKYGETYSFEPDKNYCGAFDDFLKKKRRK